MRDTATNVRHPIGALSQRWEELHSSAAQLAEMADLSPETSDRATERAMAAFPAMLSDASEWQREMAWQGIEDIDAMLQPGLCALNIVTSRGQDAGAPAMALWREFHHARDAVLDVVQPAR